ncbi:MAG: uridine kinase [bacterium]
MAGALLSRHPGHPLRVALDGPDAGGPMELAGSVADALAARGRASVALDATWFWRDASLRLEDGRTDALSYRTAWLDGAALHREVLTPLGPDGSRNYLPALRDPVTNRSARLAYQRAGPDEVVVLAGAFLLGRSLPFDVTIHLALDPAARARRTPGAAAWTMPAWEDYDAEVRPLDVADMVVRWNDANRPALSVTQ